MHRRGIAVACAVVSAIALTGCEPKAEASAASYTEFRAALDAGGDCPALFEIRNRMDPKGPDIDRVNEDLRLVGCYSSSSTRTAP